MNRRGMLAMMDAMIFIVLLALVSMTIFAIGVDDDVHEPLDASELCEHVLSTDMTQSGLVPNMGASKYRMVDVAAYATVNGSDTIMAEIRSMFDDLTMGVYEYSVIFECNGKTQMIGDWNSLYDSTYTGTWNVICGQKLEVSMQLL